MIFILFLKVESNNTMTESTAKYITLYKKNNQEDFSPPGFQFVIDQSDQ